ncbi:hypothetical protein FHS15_000138 [Paenibacillus castaneae]|nr:hypothetical protein [Paenibacillus castaneae]NIK75040.1 hypothetical protein [Paenibacillus castaneae]
MALAEIMDLTVACLSFPSLPTDMVWRDNLLDTIESLFEDGHQNVILEAKEGFGKTIFLGQLATRHPNKTLSLFIRPNNMYGYDPSIIKYDLCNQLQWILYKEEIKDFSNVDDTALKMKLFELHKRLRRNKDRFFFIIDGLEDIPKENEYIKELIIEMLPLGYESFKFVFASKNGSIIKLLDNKVETKGFPLSGFSIDETKLLYHNNSITEDSIKELHKICKGIPGKLSAVKRNINSGLDTERIIFELHNQFVDLYELEWRQIDETNDKLIELLSITALDRKLNDISFYSKLLDIDAKVIEGFIDSISFLELNNSKQVTFLSEEIQKFAAKKLAHNKQHVHDLLISFFLNDPESDLSIEYLPNYLEYAGRFEDFLNYLSPELFEKMLVQAQSIYTVQHKTDIAIKAADNLSRDGDLIRFCLSKSLIKQNNQPKIWISEIEARMLLNDYDRAVALTQTTNLLDERLHMLTIIAKIKKEQGLTPDFEILEEIKNLYNRIDYKQLGEKAVVIASNLLYCFPDLAIELMEKLTGGKSGKRENELDWALATLSLAAISTKVESDSNLEFTETIKDIRSKIKNPEVKKFSTEAALLISDYSAKEVLGEVQKLESNTDQLYFLGHWAKGGKFKDGAEDVLEYALNLTLNKAAYAPNALIYLNISQLIKHIDDVSKKKSYINIFDSQKKNIEKSGPTEDYISLQLILAENEKYYDENHAYQRLMEIYFYISEIEDIETKTSGFAMLYMGIAKIDLDNVLEEKEGINTVVRSDLNGVLDNLLQGTADQIHHLKTFINQFSKVDMEFILNIIEKINTEINRNAAYSLCIQSLLEERISAVNIKIITDIITKITDHDLINEAIYDVIHVAAEKVEEIDDDILSKLMSIFDRVSWITEAEIRCDACCELIKIFKSNLKYKVFNEKIQEELRHTWDNIDIGWRKIDIGFKIISELSHHSLELAKEYLELTEAFRENTLLDDPKGSWTFISTLRLVIRSFSGLLKEKFDVKPDFERISFLIKTIPSSGEKARLYSELAVSFFLSGRIEEGKLVVRDFVKKNVEQIAENDRRYKYFIISNICVSLYLAHKLTAFEVIDELPSLEKDVAYLKICEYIMRKLSPTQPFDEVYAQTFKLNYEEIIDICELLEKITHDTIVYDVIKTISFSLTTKESNSLISKQQNSSIIQKLQQLISDKFPNPRHITHEGYKIASLAYVWRMDRNKSMKYWNDLVIMARDIPNTSDKALVISILLGCLNRKEFNNQSDILIELEGIVSNIPTMLDKIQSYESISNILIDIDSTMSKKYLKKAMELTLKKEDEEINSAQKRIIDFAHRIDPELANSLVSLTDDDTARKSINKKLNEQLGVLELRKKMLEKKKENKPEENGYSREQYVKASYRLLASLNAGRVETVNFESTKEYLLLASSILFDKSYTTYSWIIENAVKRYSNTNHAITYLRPILESCLIAAEVSLKLSSRNTKQLKLLKINTIKANDESLFIKSGEREVAIQYIRDWLEKELSDYIKICDPYFGVEDLEILQLIRTVNPDCYIEILTSVKHHEKVEKPWESTYKNYWRIHLSDQDPPDTKVVITGTKSKGVLPIHDRWWITKNSGVRVGTSFNSIGKRESEISILTKNEVEIREKEMDKYLNMVEKEHEGERLQYSIFNL